MDAKPKRRWYQFSLRTMFVLVFIVSIPMAWVGYSMNWIRERREWTNRHPFLVGGMFPPRTEGPYGLWLFGEQAVDSVGCKPSEENEVRRLFPEARIHILPDR
jgi:hypothetical protein